MTGSFLSSRKTERATDKVYCTRDEVRPTPDGRFDIRKFHDTVLLCGALPLAVLEQVVDAYIAKNKG